MPANSNYPVSTSTKVTNIWGDTDYGAADEGAYFVTTNPTVGTAVATTTSVVDDAATASATHAQNVPVMHIINSATAGDPNGKSIYLKYLTMMLSQVPTSASTWRFAIRLSQVSRLTSGTLLFPQNTNAAAQNTSIAKVYFGAPVTALDPVNRLVCNGTVGSVIPVTLDVWTFTFGVNAIPTNFLNGSASAKNVTIPCPPIVIGPGCNMNFEMWGTSNAAAPSWEFTMGHVERLAGL